MKLRTQGSDGLEQFTFQGEGVRVCGGQEEAVRLVCQGDKTGLLQACIHTARPETFRARWTPDGLEVYLIREIDQEKHVPFQSRPTSKIEVSKYQHKATDFVYASKLLRSSFSPYSPFRSVLSSEGVSPRGTHSPRSIPTSNEQFPQVQWEGEGQNCEVYKLESSCPAIAALGSTLAFALTVWKHLPKGAIEEIIFDCVLGQDSHYYLFRCLGFSATHAQMQGQAEIGPLRIPSLASPRHGYVKATKNDTIEFYGKTFGMKKGGLLPFKIIGVKARNHEAQLHASFEERLDPLLRSQRQRKKLPPTAPDSAADFMTRVENNFDELMLKARQSKVDMEAVRKMMAEVVKDTTFGERIFFSFFERCRGIPALLELFSNRTREQIEALRRKFIDTLQNPDLLTTIPKTRPTALFINVTSEQYSLLDQVLQRVLGLEDLPRLAFPITKERLFLIIGDMMQEG